MDVAKDALDELFSSESEIAINEVIRDVLIEYVKLSPDGKIFPLMPLNKLDNEKKTACLSARQKSITNKIQCRRKNKSESTSKNKRSTNRIRKPNFANSP